MPVKFQQTLFKIAFKRDIVQYYTMFPWGIAFLDGLIKFLPGGPKKRPVFERPLFDKYTLKDLILLQKSNFICLVHNPARTSQTI